MIMRALFLLSLSSYIFAGEPINRVAQQQKGSALSNVRTALSNALRSKQGETCVLCVAKGADVLATAILSGVMFSAFLQYNDCAIVCTDAFKIEDGYRYLDYQDQCIDINL